MKPKGRYFVSALLIFAMLLSGCASVTPTEGPTELPVTDAPATEAPTTETPTTEATEATEATLEDEPQTEPTEEDKSLHHESNAEPQAAGTSIVHGKGITTVGTLTIGYYNYLEGAYKTAYIQSFELKTLGSATVYCLEPEKTSPGQNYTAAQQYAAWQKLPRGMRYAIGLALAYGYPNQHYSASPNDIYWYGNQEMLNVENYFATQLIIWEILSGVRSSYAPYALTGSTSYRNAFDSGWATIRSTYDAIAAKMAKHNGIPAYAGDEFHVPIYELQYDTQTGTYRYLLPAERLRGHSGGRCRIARRRLDDHRAKPLSGRLAGYRRSLLDMQQFPNRYGHAGRPRPGQSVFYVKGRRERHDREENFAHRRR